MKNICDIISKELMNEVLGEKVTHTETNLCYFSEQASSMLGVQSDLIKVYWNIHELENLTIDWLEAQDYWIRKPSKNIYELYWGNTAVYSIETSSRLKVPFMCGQWLLKNKKDKK